MRNTIFFGPYKTLSLFLLLFLSLIQPMHASPATEKDRAKALVALLAEMQEREKVVPDSFFSDVRLLRSLIEQESDSVSKSVYRASLAHLLVLNTFRSQARQHNTISHPDSIREWSQDDYRSNAAQLYTQALSDMKLLHNTPSRQWMPLLNKGADEQVFGGDMLNVVWRALENDLTPALRLQQKTPDYADLIAFYRSKGLREAELLLMLDSLYATTYKPEEQREALMELRDRFRNTSACAWVYLRLSECQNPSISDGPNAHNRLKEEQLQWAKEGLRLYPTFSKKKVLEDRVRWLERPQLQACFNDRYYPHSKVHIPLFVANMKRLTLRVYQLSADFKWKGNHATHSLQVSKVGRLVQTIQHRFKSRKPSEEWNDTLHWQTPGFGRYAVVVEGDTEASLARKAISDVAYFEVSSLAFLSTNLPNGLLRIVALDAQSGEPQKDVDVDFLTESNGEDVLLTRRITDSCGKVYFTTSPSRQRNSLKVRLTKGLDSMSSPTSVSGSSYLLSAQVDSVRNLRIYTDRSIYRPGQQVFVAAVAYKQKDWGARVETNRKYTLSFYDTNRQLLRQRELQTDAFGVLSDTLLLPQEGLPGEYMIRIGTQMTWIKVEEYRRPTFRVEIESIPEYKFATDCLTVTGRAITYSGVPLRNARVTGFARWRGSHWWRKYYAPATESLDTVYTDSEGCFAVRVAVPRDAERMRWGQWLSMAVDVLSPQGETQQGETQMHFCSEPLRLFADVREKQDKSRPTPWMFSLLSSTEKPIEAPVHCRLVSETTSHNFTMQAGVSTVPDGLQLLPSGKYTLYAQAKVGIDSVRLQKQIVLFGDEDRRLVLDTALWVYAPVDTFDCFAPAHIRIGTSLQNAWVHVCMVAEGMVVADSTLSLSDSIINWKVPYKENYGQGLRCVVALFRDGRMYSHAFPLYLRQPNGRLRLRWDVFRNHTRPGAKQEWRLSVYQPDGTPAQANLMLSLYDASLSALAPHKINLSLSRSHRIPSLGFYSSSGFSGLFNCAGLQMEVKQSGSSGYVFTTLNNSLFPTLARVESVTFGKYMQARSVNSTLSKSMTTAAGNVVTDVDAVPESAESEDEAVEPLSPSSADLRKDMQELAYFAPQLRTDSNGQTAISFTLPESLTSWKLTGFAHTADLLVSEIEETIVAQKELMAELHLPRYLRVGDKATLTASIRNISQETQSGTATWHLLDAETEKVLQTFRFPFSLLTGADTTYYIPVGVNAQHTLLAVQWKASSQCGSDGERRILPVLSDRQQVTTTQAFQLSGLQTKRIDLQTVFPKKAENRLLTIEYTSQPLWLALQSLPSLASPQRLDVLSLASAYYAGALAHYIVHQNADVADALQQWTQTEQKQSALYENQQLASVFMHETPWVMQAHNDAERKKHLVSLFQPEGHLQRAMSHLAALRTLQQPDGSFSWYPGMKGTPYLTGEVVILLTRLKRLTHDMTPDAATVAADVLLEKAISYMQREVQREVQNARKDPEAYRMSLQSQQYLYAISGRPLLGDAKKDVDFLVGHLRQQATRYQMEGRAFAAILLHLYGHSRLAIDLLPQLRAQLQHPDGFYLAYPSGSFVSIDRKIQRHVLLMETFSLLSPEDTTLHKGMQLWLLQQKRTQEWEQPLQTADAVYALLQTESLDSVCEEPSDEIVVSGTRVEADNQDGFGTLRRSYSEPSIPHRLAFHKKSPGMSWGAIYAQYTETVRNVEAQSTGLSLRREVDSSALCTGQRLHVRYILSVDADYEYVRLFLPRIAAAEPDNQISGYRWQNGLSYYRAVHDTGAEYFIDSLPKGTYVLEEDWFLTRAGVYQWAPAQLQCLYAPVYQAHTHGTELHIQ